MDLQQILNDPPQIHRDESGQPYFMGLLNEALIFIDKHVNEDSVTLETGSGVSTVLFALKGTHHTCIVPNKVETDRIKEYCREQGVSTDKIDFQVERSDLVLPSLVTQPLDLVLIDGSHAFPAPFIDWHYTYPRMKKGGLLVIDDTHVWTGSILKQFLLEEPEWTLEADFAPRTAVFIKLTEGDEWKEWYDQPYTVRNSNVANAIDHPTDTKLHRAVGHLRRGELLTLIQKTVNNIKRL